MWGVGAPDGRRSAHPGPGTDFRAVRLAGRTNALRPKGRYCTFRLLLVLANVSVSAELVV